MTPTLPDFSRGRVLIVGDVMLDRYWHGATSRISPEAPVPVVKVDMDEFRAGGAGNVALNVATLGGHTRLVGLVGDDESAGLLRARLEAGRVDCHFVPVAGSHTITKLRVISRHQQLIRLDFEDGFTRAEAAAVRGRRRRAIGTASTGRRVAASYSRTSKAAAGCGASRRAWVGAVAHLVLAVLRSRRCRRRSSRRSRKETRGECGRRRETAPHGSSRRGRPTTGG